VAHSLGGLVVEAALAYSRHTANEHHRNIERYTKGIVFMGTPHYGSQLASWGVFGTNMLRILGTNSDIVAVLRSNSEILANVQQDFQAILRLREHDQEREKINITCFSEELPMAGIGMVRVDDRPFQQ